MQMQMRSRCQSIRREEATSNCDSAKLAAYGSGGGAVECSPVGCSMTRDSESHAETVEQGVDLEPRS